MPKNAVMGYQTQTQSKEKIALINQSKRLEEMTLRHLDKMAALADSPDGERLIDPRWLATGRTQLEKAYMSINRAVFQPTRITLRGDV
jgi:hypothetical protein